MPASLDGNVALRKTQDAPALCPPTFWENITRARAQFKQRVNSSPPHLVADIPRLKVPNDLSRIIDNPFSFGKMMQGLQVYGFNVIKAPMLGVDFLKNS